MDLPNFKREWSNYVHVMKSCHSSPLTEFVILHTFKDCLKDGAAVRVDQMITQNPLLTMADVWRDMDARYGGDTHAQEKAKWKAIRLVKTGGE